MRAKLTDGRVIEIACRPHESPCPECGGQGGDCPACYGAGTVHVDPYGFEHAGPHDYERGMVVLDD